MQRGSYILRDATHDPSARERARHAPELSRALITLGFTTVGIVNAVFKAPGIEKNYFASMDRADAEKMLSAVRVGEAVEVMTSHDGLVFGVVERTVENPVIALQTILENGIIVETTMRPDRAPRPFLGTGAGKPLTAWVTRLIAGDPPVWPRGNWLAAGYLVELVDTRDASHLLDRHYARLQALQERYHTSVPSHAKLDVYLAIRLRFQQIMGYRVNWAMLLDGVILTVMMLALLYIPRSMSLMDILFVLYACALVLLAIGVVHRVIVPELGPRPTRFEKLLAQLQKEKNPEKW